MRVVLGADHAGYPAKPAVFETLTDWGHDVVDVGTFSEEPVDFPDIAAAVTSSVLGGDADRGILICGTGIGACMAANKVRGIRAALAHDIYSAHQSVEHDDANVLCLGAQVVGPKVMLDLIRTWLDARWLPDEAFRRRVAKLEAGATDR